MTINMATNKDKCACGKRSEWDCDFFEDNSNCPFSSFENMIAHCNGTGIEPKEQTIYNRSPNITIFETANKNPNDYQKVVFYDSKDVGSWKVGFFVPSQTPMPKHITHWFALPDKPYTICEPENDEQK